MTTRIQYGLMALGGAATGALTIALAQSGCTVLQNDALPDDAFFEGGSEASTPVCTECVAQECLGQWSTCLTDDGCRAIRACASGGGANATCFCASTAGATDGGPNPSGAYLAFASCNDAKTCTTCSTDCTATCSGGSPSTTPGACSGGTDAGSDADTDGGDAATPDAAATVTVDSCKACIDGKCGDPKKACAADTECAAFLSCSYACTSTSCQDACATSHATGKEAASELASCTLASCAEACGL